MTKITKKTAVKTESAANIDEMEQMSGEKDTKSAPKYVLPSVKLNGKTGSFFRTVIEDGKLKTGDDGKAVLEDMGKSVSGTILKVRKTFFSDSAESQLYTNEVGNNKKDKVSVFCKTENGKGGYTIVPVFAGSPSQVKQRFPEISMIQIIYFLLEDTGEIVRLKVKGMSLGQLFSYWKKFDSSEHIFEYVTELGVKADKNKYGSFFVNTFEKGDLVKDLMPVQTAMKEVYDHITEIDEFFKDSFEEVSIVEDEPEVSPTPEPEDDEPLYDLTDEQKAANRTALGVDDEIDVKDIPF